MVDRKVGKTWLDAAKGGQIGTMKQMLSATPALLSYRQPGIGNSALHWAAARNNEELISWLLAGGIEPNLANGSGATALHSAASNDSWEAVNLLLKTGCDAAIKDEDGNTARDSAALRDHSKVAAFLETRGHLFQGAKKAPAEWVVHTDGDGVERRAEIVHKGTENLAPGEDPYYTIRFEDGTERNTVPEKLVPTAAPEVAPIPEPGPAPAPVPAPRPMTPGDAAAAPAEDDEPVEVAGPPVLKDGWMVVPTGNVLVDKEVGVPWFDAAKGGDLPTLQRLLAQEPMLLYYRGKGISYGFVGHSALHWAAAKGHVAIVRWLIGECQVNPNVRNNGDGTPLHAAGMGGQHETGRALCELGIDTTLRNSQGNQARDEALHYQHPDLAQTIDHFTLARKMIKEKAAEEPWSIKNMKGLLASAKLPYDFSEKGEFIAATTTYLDGISAEAPDAPTGTDSSVTKKVAAPAVAPDGDESESTDEDEMGAMMSKLLIKQGKTALSLKEEGNAAFKLGTKDGYHRAGSRYAQALCLDPDEALRLVLHSNHAECMIQLGRNLKAKVSAEKALGVDPTVSTTINSLLLAA